MVNKISTEDSQALIEGLEAIKKFAQVVARLEVTHGELFMEDTDEFIQRFESADDAEHIRELTKELNKELVVKN